MTKKIKEEKTNKKKNKQKKTHNTAAKNRMEEGEEVYFRGRVIIHWIAR